MSIATDVARIQAEIVALREDFNQLTNIVTQQAQIIRDFEDERQRRLGSQGTIRFLWGLLTAGIAGIAYSLHDILVFFIPPKIH